MVCQSEARPSTAEYWHIGDTTMRLTSLSWRREKGENRDVGIVAGFGLGMSLSARIAYYGRKRSWRPTSAWLRHLEYAARRRGTYGSGRLRQARAIGGRVLRLGRFGVLDAGSPFLRPAFVAGRRPNSSGARLSASARGQ